MKNSVESVERKYSLLKNGEFLVKKKTSKKTVKKVKKDADKKEAGFDRLGPSEKWEKGRKISEATPLRIRDSGVKGISFRMGSKLGENNYPKYGKTIWIDEDLDLPEWMNWFITTIKKMYFSLFGKKVLDLDESIVKYETKIQHLTKQLSDAQNELEMKKALDEERKQFIELVSKSEQDVDTLDEKFSDFKDIIEESYNENVGKEEDIKEKIKESRWLVGLECYVDSKNRDVDTQLEIDLHVITKFGHHRIFEVKSPNVKPFVRKSGESNRRLVISSELADGISELIMYMRKTDFYSSLKTEGTYGIQKASGIILMGYKLTDSEKEILNELNNHLQPLIRICTYDDLVFDIEREIELLKTIKSSNNSF